MYAVLDIESTGGKYNEEGIMEIAVHRFDGHQVVDKFIALINPEREIQPFVAKLTGINNKMLRSAPKFHEVAKRIVEITKDAIIVAHNAQFDYRILRTEFRRLGYDFKRKTLCTVELSKKLIPEAESHSLGKLVRSLGIPVSDRHRANGDALATLKLFKLLLAKDSEKEILQTVVRTETQGELSPTQLDIVESLPVETGIYYLHNKDGEIIFLGASKNIKKRVNQHFTNVGILARKLQKETKKVSFQKTGSELTALLQEQHEISRKNPKYNTRKTKGYSHGIYLKQSKDGKLGLDVERANGQTNRLSSFTSLKSGRAFLKKMGEAIPWEQAKNEKEAKELIAMAFDTYSIAQKNLILVDRGRSLGEQSVVLIKDGTATGIAYVELNHQLNNMPILEKLITPIAGNSSTTYIIESYLRKSNRIKKIPLNPVT